MTVELICVAGGKNQPMQTVDAVQLEAGAGIVGEHHFGTVQQYPGQNVTLVEAEEIERFNAEYGTALNLTATRRNLVTRGVRLNELVGVEFTVGSVLLRGVELCEPCATLGRYLADTGLTPAQVVKGLAHRAGLRADVVSSGVVRSGDSIVASAS
jgi:MOSC domain-containing protein YiiM